MLQCQNLAKSYGSNHALKPLDLTLEKGKPLALVGPNGAGKTTLFGLICGFIHPSKGSIQVLGHAPDHPELKGKLAALPQDAQLDPRFSIGKQLILYARLQGMNKGEARDEARRVLSLVDLGDAFDHKPSQLSHGMRKRACIAQTFIGEPELILLDEPTAGLDPLNAKVIRELILAHKHKINFIISSHNLYELEDLCGQVIYLEKGQITQHSDLTQDGPSGEDHLSLHLDAQAENLTPLQDIEGIEEVKALGEGKYLLRYNATRYPKMDIQLLEVLHEHKLRYRQLTQGMSLEDKLFSTQS